MSAEIVSVIIVTYNHERFIADALDSVLMQETAFPVEVLVSDDASTDNTCEVVRRYVAFHPGQMRLLCSERNLNTNEVTTRAITTARRDVPGDYGWGRLLDLTAETHAAGGFSGEVPRMCRLFS